MKAHCLFALLLLPALTLAGLAFAEAPQGGGKTKPSDKGKAERAKIAAAIKKDGKLPKAKYWNHAEAQRGAKAKKIPAVVLHTKGKGKAPLQGDGEVALQGDGNEALQPGGIKSQLTVVGGDGLPKGFGSGFHWDRNADQDVVLVMFINAADPLGVSIDGLEAGDEIQVLSASGIASFSSDKGNPLASSIVGLLAKVGDVVVTAKGAAEAVPAIDAAAQFAKDQFKATNAKTLRRDAFGVDPGSGLKARQEGGLIVCLPEAGGTFYSGDPKARWIQGNGDRTDDHLPTHLSGCFFPRQGDVAHNTRIVQQSGQMFVLAWDWQFDDNAGFYKVFMHLKKGNGLVPPIIERKK
jgi:hypothetical protein